MSTNTSMDTSINILNDPLMNSLYTLKAKRVNILMKENGIKTVEDFLNADLISMFNSKTVLRQLTGLQRVLQYKYCKHATIPQDFYLDEIYYPGAKNRTKNIEMFEKLGFVATTNIFSFADKLAAEYPSDPPMIIDIIDCLESGVANEYAVKLARFYSKYYTQTKKIQMSDITPEALNEIKRKIVEIEAMLKSEKEKLRKFEEIYYKTIKGTSKNEK